MAEYLDPKDTREIQDQLTTWLQTNLDDPYEQAATPKTRSTFVYGDDFKLVSIFPKIHVAVADDDVEKITAQKSSYLEGETHHFMIYYYNQQAHRYSFDGLVTYLTNASQCRKYLQYIKSQLKTNITDFNDYFSQLIFGTIPTPVFDSKTSTWISVLPITVKTYRR